jgi:hypothetical protein
LARRDTGLQLFDDVPYRKTAWSYGSSEVAARESAVKRAPNFVGFLLAEPLSR